MLFKCHSGKAEGLIFLICCPSYLKLYFELSLLNLQTCKKIQANKQNPEQSQPTQLQGWNLQLSVLTLRRKDMERCQTTIFLLHQWLRLRQSCSVDKDGQICVEVCFALMGAEKPRRVVRAKCPKNRGGRVSRVHQVTKLCNNSPLVTFLDFGVFLIFCWFCCIWF